MKKFFLHVHLGGALNGYGSIISFPIYDKTGFSLFIFFCNFELSSSFILCCMALNTCNDSCSFKHIFLFLMILWTTPIHAEVSHVGSECQRCVSVYREIMFLFRVFP